MQLRGDGVLWRDSWSLTESAFARVLGGDGAEGRGGGAGVEP